MKETDDMPAKAEDGAYVKVKLISFNRNELQ
jgi:hypothetical protein